MARSSGGVKNLLKMGMKYGPVLYPIVKKYLAKRKASKVYRPR